MTKKLFDVIEVSVVGQRKLRVKFEDGLEGEVDMSLCLEGPVFGPLRYDVRFAQVFIENGTVAWPNGADLAPDAMYDNIARKGCWVIPPRRKK